MHGEGLESGLAYLVGVGSWDWCFFCQAFWDACTLRSYDLRDTNAFYTFTLLSQLDSNLYHDITIRCT